MADEHDQGAADAERLARAVAGRVARRAQAAQLRHRSLWFSLGLFGLVGWSVMLPAVAGAFLGSWLDGQSRTAPRWTLTLLVTGVVLGCVNAWHFLQRERQ